MHDSKDYSNNFITMDFSNERDIENKYTIENSLFKETFSYFKQEEIIDFKGGVFLIGFYINKKNTRAHFNLICNDEVLSEISLVRDVDLKSFLNIFIPSPIKNKIDTISFNSKASDDSCVPLTYHPLVKDKVVECPFASISKLCTWKPSGIKWQSSHTSFLKTDEVTKEINVRINSYFWKNRRFELKGKLLFSSHGYVVMFDEVLQQCISIDKNLIVFYPNDLLQVNVKVNDNTSASFWVDLHGVIVTLNCFSYGIALSDTHCLSNRKIKRLGVDLGSEFFLNKNNGMYTFLIEDKYLRCYKMNVDHGFKFNAKKASLWERFHINDTI